VKAVNYATFSERFLIKAFGHLQFVQDLFDTVLNAARVAGHLDTVFWDVNRRTLEEVDGDEDRLLAFLKDDDEALSAAERLRRDGWTGKLLDMRLLSLAFPSMFTQLLLSPRVFNPHQKAVKAGRRPERYVPTGTLTTNGDRGYAHYPDKGASDKEYLDLNWEVADPASMLEVGKANLIGETRLAMELRDGNSHENPITRRSGYEFAGVELPVARLSRLLFLLSQPSLPSSAFASH
jgi:hypothetical protein